jgi:hypothetical protein
VGTGTIEAALDRTLVVSSPWHCPARGDHLPMSVDDGLSPPAVPHLTTRLRRVYYREAVDGKSVELGVLLTEPQGPRRTASVAYRRGRNWVIDPDAHYGVNEFEGWWELDEPGD